MLINHKKKIEELLSKNRVLVFMKGGPDEPACRFSAQVVDILDRSGVDYGYYDILEDEEIRQAIKEYSNWPTLPQVFVEGKFIGGADILAELEENGELKVVLG